MSQASAFESAKAVMGHLIEAIEPVLQAALEAEWVVVYLAQAFESARAVLWFLAERFETALQVYLE